MTLKWTSDLAVGVKEIDNQHKELFRTVNSLLEAMNKGNGKEEVRKVIGFLEGYVVKHFNTEEEFMTRYGYLNYAAHKSEHLIFVREFTGMKRELENGVTASAVLKIHRRVADWLIDHVAGTDKAMGAFVNSSRMKKAA
jgi:hemerythrin